MVLDVLRALGRRWYAVFAGLLVTCALVYGAWNASPPEYHARGLVLLLPSQAAVGKGGNPFLQLSGLEQPAGILVAYFSSAPAIEEVRALSPSAEYQVGIEDSTRGPVIAVDVTASQSQEALSTLNHLVARIPEELASLQRQVAAPTDSAIGSMVLTVDNKADVNHSGTLRTLIAALVVGIVGTGVLTFALDSFLRRRSLGEGAAGPTQRRGGKRHEKVSNGGGEADAPEDGAALDRVREPSWAGRET